MTQQNLADEQKDREVLKTKHGVDIFTPSAAEIDRMTAKMIPYWDAWAQQNGPNAVAALKEIRQVLGR